MPPFGLVLTESRGWPGKLVPAKGARKSREGREKVLGRRRSQSEDDLEAKAISKRRRSRSEGDLEAKAISKRRRSRSEGDLEAKAISKRRRSRSEHDLKEDLKATRILNRLSGSLRAGCPSIHFHPSLHLLNSVAGRAGPGIGPDIVWLARGPRGIRKTCGTGREGDQTSDTRNHKTRWRSPLSSSGLK